MDANKVVISGGSGLVGRALTAALVAEGHGVVWLTRSPGRMAAEEVPDGVTLAGWDPTGNAALDPAVVSAAEGVEAVVHLAGAKVDQRWTDASRRAIRDSRVVSTRVLTDALEALPANDRPKTFLGGSAIGWYGTGETVWTADDPHGEGFLAEVVADWEAAEARAVALGMRVAIVRTGLVLAPNGGMLARLLPLYRLGLGSPVGSGQQWQSWVHVSDLAQIFVHLLHSPTAQGVYNGVAPEGAAVRQAELSATLAKALHRPHFMPAVPAFALRLVFGDMADTILGSQHVIPSRLAAEGFQWQFPELGTALQDLVSAS